MKELVKAVGELAKKEFKDTTKVHPPFASDHEGVAVIEEEVIETSEALKGVMVALRNLKQEVYNDEVEDENVMVIQRLATYTAAEAIQVAAMALKFGISRKIRKKIRDKRN